MGIQNDDNDVSNILYDMLTQSQIHKENDDHEAVEVDTIVSNENVINNHEHTVKDVEHRVKNLEVRMKVNFWFVMLIAKSMDWALNL